MVGPGPGPGKFMKCRTDSDEKTVELGPARTRGKTILGPDRTGTEILSRSRTGLVETRIEKLGLDRTVRSGPRTKLKSRTERDEN